MSAIMFHQHSYTTPQHTLPHTHHKVHIMQHLPTPLPHHHHPSPSHIYIPPQPHPKHPTNTHQPPTYSTHSHDISKLNMQHVHSNHQWEPSCKGATTVHLYIIKLHQTWFTKMGTMLTDYSTRQVLIIDITHTTV